MKTMGDSTLATLIGSKFGETGFVATNVSPSTKIHPPLGETLPYRFAILSPVIGVFAGFGLAWLSADIEIVRNLFRLSRIRPRSTIQSDSGG